MTENTKEQYDSTNDTLKHIAEVNEYMKFFAAIIVRRGEEHDKSKLEAPEKAYFDEMTPILKDLVYGSPEYKESCQKLGPALKHHYANNSHHPQFYENGINGMDLFDLVEMFCDWKASSERTKDGDMNKSLVINAERHGMSKQLKQIFQNTINRLKT